MAYVKAGETLRLILDWQDALRRISPYPPVCQSPLFVPLVDLCLEKHPISGLPSLPGKMK